MNPYSDLGTPDFLAASQNLSPSGRAWPRDASSTYTAFLNAGAGMQSLVHGIASDLVEVELNPFTTNELLPDWETDFGLPDPCVPQPQTYGQRIDALLSRIADPGGLNPQRYIDLAAANGFVITITEFHPFRANDSCAGDPCCDPSWIFAWQVNAPATEITSVFRCTSPCTDPLQSWGNAELECLIDNRNRPSRVALFSYGGG